MVRGGKGDKDRVVMLPGSCAGRLAEQVRRARHRHERDVRRGGGYVPAADPVGHKCAYADRDWRWQFSSPASSCGATGEGAASAGGPTMLYTHVMTRPAAAVTSPLDRLTAVDPTPAG